MTRSGKERGGGGEGWWVGPIYGDNAQIKFTRRRSRKLCDVKTRIKGARESWKGDAVSLTFGSKSCCFVWGNYYLYQTLGHAVVGENFINRLGSAWCFGSECFTHSANFLRFRALLDAVNHGVCSRQWWQKPAWNNGKFKPVRRDAFVTRIHQPPPPLASLTIVGLI